LALLPMNTTKLEVYKYVDIQVTRIHVEVV
jgi:hypothetical protein